MIDGDQMQKLAFLFSLIYHVPPTIKEKILHDIFSIMGYKLSPQELLDLHNFTFPTIGRRFVCSKCAAEIDADGDEAVFVEEEGIRDESN